MMEDSGSGWGLKGLPPERVRPLDLIPKRVWVTSLLFMDCQYTMAGESDFCQKKRGRRSKRNLTENARR
jgi:hypothetical protein